MKKRFLITWLAVLSIFSVAFSISYWSITSVMASPPPPMTLMGHVPDIVAQGHAHLVGHHPATDHLTLAIGLQLRNKQALNQFLSEVSDPTNSHYGHYMTQAKANQTFNPTSQQEQQVATWLRVNGLKVIRTYPNHLLVDTSGTFGQVEQMLHLTLNDYTTTVGGKQIAFYAPANEPTVDGSVSGIVESIVGLDNYPRVHGDALRFHPAANGNPDNTPPYYPQDFANAYDVNPLWNAGATGTGQNIGITLWVTPPSDNTLQTFGSNTGADIATQANGRLRLILVDGSSAYFGTQNEQIEAAMDIEYTSGLAPGATINYYESPTDSQNHPTSQGLDDALNQAGTDANTNRQISSSWGGCEASSTSDPFTSTTENILSSNSTTGHNYFFSSGDSGSACVPDPTSPCTFTDPQPAYPASSAYVTSVGGTTFSANINGSYPGEVAWTYSASNCPTLNNPQAPVGSGGGYSKLFNRPKWQSGTGLAKNGKRGYPDIAADADPSTGAYVCYGQSPPSCNSIGGTSLASPLWAGMLGDVNQYLQQQSQPLLGLIDPTLYSLATHQRTYTPFHDITSGTNGQYQASMAWDAVTGWGSPDLYNLARDILWSVVPSPSPNPGVYSSQLNGMAAISSNNVWAVGYNFTNTLIERWNGKKWSVVASPNPGQTQNVLNGVAAVSTKDIWAVGFDNGQTLTEHWDGTSWSAVASPSPGSNGSFLTGVAVVSTNDVWAVGYYENSTYDDQTLIEHWDGTSWNVVPSPSPGSCQPYYQCNNLSGVAVVSANNIWAVGNNMDYYSLVEHWDGTSWSVVSSPNPGPFNFLYGVAVVSANNIWTVGNIYNTGNNTNQTLIERWNGKKWSVVPSPNPSTSENVLYSVSVVSSNNIWAVGNYDNNTLIEHWNGAVWSVIFSPNLSTSCPGYNVWCNMFFGVAALSVTDVWAAGEYQDSTGTTYTLTEHYV